jgi:hypothetical protein
MPSWKALSRLAARPKKDHKIDGRVSPFVALPPETRNCIYEYILISRWTILIAENLTPIKKRAKHVVPPALCRTNQQIRHETLPIWYSDNTFEIHCSFNHRAEEGRFPDVAFTKAFHWLHDVVGVPERRRQLGSLVVCTRYSFEFMKDCLRRAAAEEVLTPYAKTAKKLELEIDSTGEGNETCAANQLNGETLKHFRLRIRP